MKWNKTGKNYSASCDGVETTFNLDGMIVTKKFVSQEEAIKFLANEVLKKTRRGRGKNGGGLRLL